MLQTLSQAVVVVGVPALIVVLLYLLNQVSDVRRHMRADATNKRVTSRINIWLQEWDKEAFHSALDKFFEYELYKRDCPLHELEELNLREVRAYRRWLSIELLSFMGLFEQRQSNLVDRKDSLPLDYMLCLSSAPARREWKDTFRLNGHYPEEYIVFVDHIVKKYDGVEQHMNDNEDANYNEVFQNTFDVPPPPSWLRDSDTS